MMISSKKAGLGRLLSESSHIIITHPLNFLTLSALFLFPITFFTAFYPDLPLHPTTSVAPQYNQILSTPDSEKTETPPLTNSQSQFLYTIVALLFSICATSSITRTTINALLNRPVQSLKSIPLLFFPILVTKLATLLIMGLTAFAFTLFMGLIAFAFFGIDFISTRYFMASVYVEMAVLVGVMTYLGVQWCLIYPIVVLESTWGFAPLKRSWYLVKGMRGVIFLMMILFQIPSLIMWIWNKNLMANYNEGRHTGWIIALMVIYVVFVTILSLYSLVFFAVLCVYCKDLHGETVDDKLGVEFAKLPLDDLL